MAFVTWALLGGCLLYWGIQLLARPMATPTDAVLASEQGAAQVDLSRLLGASPVAAPAPEPQPVEASRFQLLGVVAARSERARNAGEGLALIAVDGVARTVRVGAALDGDLRLLLVEPRSASLGRAGQVLQVLQLAPPAEATTGALPPAAPSPVVLGGNPGVRPVPGSILPPSAGVLVPRQQVLPAGVAPNPDPAIPNDAPPVQDNGLQRR